MQMISLKQHRYSGKTLKPGEHFVASRRDARVLKAMRVAADASPLPESTTIAEDPPPVVPDFARLAVLLAPAPVEDAPVEPAPVEPDPVETPGEAPEDPADELLAEPRPKRSYKRRDMTAED